MSDEKNATKSFEMKVQEQQDKIEAQFRKITRGSWARIIRMAQAFEARVPSNGDYLRHRSFRAGSHRVRHLGAHGQLPALVDSRCLWHRKLNRSVIEYDGSICGLCSL